MRNIFGSALIFLFLAISISEAQAAKGKVVYYDTGGCDYYIVATKNGFAILEWYGGHDPSEGDVIVGDYESYGMKTIFNVTADAETRVWVEDYMLSKDSVIRQYNELCK